MLLLKLVGQLQNRDLDQSLRKNLDQSLHRNLFQRLIVNLSKIQNLNENCPNLLQMVKRIVMLPYSTCLRTCLLMLRVLPLKLENLKGKRATQDLLPDQEKDHVEDQGYAHGKSLARKEVVAQLGLEDHQYPASHVEASRARRQNAEIKVMNVENAVVPRTASNIHQNLGHAQAANPGLDRDPTTGLQGEATPEAEVAVVLEVHHWKGVTGREATPMSEVKTNLKTANQRSESIY